MDEVERIAGKLSKAQIDVLFVPGPWLASLSHLDAWEHEDLRRAGLIKAVFPEAIPGNSGRQFWKISSLGLRLRNHLGDTNG